MSHIIEGSNVYYQSEGLTQLIGSTSKVDTIRIDNETVADVTYQFDLELGQYIEQSRGDAYRDPNAPDPKQFKLDELNAACNADVLAGFTSNALGTDNTYDFDYDAQINLGGMMNAITADFVTSDITWKASGVPKTHTVDQFKLVFVHGLQHKNNKIGKYWTLKGQVMAATTQAEIDAITW